MSRLHDILIGRGRTLLNRVQGRSAQYAPPSGVTGQARVDITAMWESSEDVIQVTDSGEHRLSAVVVNIEIGSGAGQVQAVHEGGLVYLDVDGSGEAVPWTIHNFLNKDVPAGFVRCQCVRPKQLSGVAGYPRPRR